MQVINAAFLIALLTITPIVLSAKDTREIPCKTSADAQSCYWTHGRLGRGNGTPSCRLWKIGTHRILGIYSGPSEIGKDDLDNEHPEFPANVERALGLGTPDQNRIFAGFEVCPLAPEVSGAMQPVCIEAAKNIVPEK
jgi:hypothetical protein